MIGNRQTVAILTTAPIVVEVLHVLQAIWFQQTRLLTSYNPIRNRYHICSLKQKQWMNLNLFQNGSYATDAVRRTRNQTTNVHAIITQTWPGGAVSFSKCQLRKPAPHSRKCHAPLSSFLHFLATRTDQVWAASIHYLRLTFAVRRKWKHTTKYAIRILPGGATSFPIWHGSNISWFPFTSTSKIFPYVHTPSTFTLTPRLSDPLPLQRLHAFLPFRSDAGAKSAGNLLCQLWWTMKNDNAG